MMVIMKAMMMITVTVGDDVFLSKASLSGKYDLFFSAEVVQWCLWENEKRVILKRGNFLLRSSWPASNHLHCWWLKSVWKKISRFLQCSHISHPSHSHSSHLPKHPAWSSHLPWYLDPSALHPHILADILLNWTFELVSMLLWNHYYCGRQSISTHTLHKSHTALLYPDLQ